MKIDWYGTLLGMSRIYKIFYAIKMQQVFAAERKSRYLDIGRYLLIHSEEA